MVTAAQQDAVVDARDTVLGPPLDVVGIGPRGGSVAAGSPAAAVAYVQRLTLRHGPLALGAADVQYLAVPTGEDAPDVRVAEQPRGGGGGQDTSVACGRHLGAVLLEELDRDDEAQMRAHPTGCRHVTAERGTDHVDQRIRGPLLRGALLRDRGTGCIGRAEGVECGRKRLAVLVGQERVEVPHAVAAAREARPAPAMGTLLVAFQRPAVRFLFLAPDVAAELVRTLVRSGVEEQFLGRAVITQGPSTGRLADRLSLLRSDLARCQCGAGPGELTEVASDGVLPLGFASGDTELVAQVARGRGVPTVLVRLGRLDASHEPDPEAGDHRLQSAEAGQPVLDRRGVGPLRHRCRERSEHAPDVLEAAGDVGPAGRRDVRNDLGRGVRPEVRSSIRPSVRQGVRHGVRPHARRGVRRDIGHEARRLLGPVSLPLRPAGRGWRRRCRFDRPAGRSRPDRRDVGGAVGVIGGG